MNEIVRSESGKESISKDTHVAIKIIDNTMGFVNDFMTIKGFANGTLNWDNDEVVKDAKMSISSADKLVSYYITIQFNKTLGESPRMKFYAKDPKQNTAYTQYDLIEAFGGTSMHTHAGNGWYVKNAITMKPVSAFKDSGIEYGSTVKEQWDFKVDADLEGCYFYIIDHRKYVQGNNNWDNTSHVEFSLFQHNIGMGAQHGFSVDTYISIWKQGVEPYINNFTNILDYDLITVLEETQTEYRFFLRFNNNLDNPADGPYMMVKTRLFDPSDNLRPYSYDDVVEYRDARFVHTTVGTSHWFNKDGFKEIKNEFEIEDLAQKMDEFKKNGLENSENLTLFIGDSYFDQFAYWKEFYNDYAGKAAHTSAIGGTKAWEWVNWVDSLVGSFDKNLKNIVIHLGYNEIVQGGPAAVDIEFMQQRLIEILHTKYPSVNIYYLGIGVSYLFSTEPVMKQKALTCDDLTETYCSDKPYVTYVDMDACVQQYLSEDPTRDLQSFYKDKTHPKDECYSYIMSALANAGLVVADK